MPLRELLRKKHAIADGAAGSPPLTPTPAAAGVPAFKFYRTDTNSQELIEPGPDAAQEQRGNDDASERLSTGFERLSVGRRRSSDKDQQLPLRRLSQRLHLSRTSSTSSVNLPADLPSIPDSYSPQGDQQDQEAQWEDRATRLAKDEGTAPLSSSASRGRSVSSPLALASASATAATTATTTKPASPDGLTVARSRPRAKSISDAAGDENIQEAIRLHEAGDLARATRMFGRLADTGNVLSQVLYGLSLRHGWGVEPDAANAVSYLRAAAANSAAIEADALKAGIKKGGAAKGELVLAIFELGNCFRHGWGVDIDKPAARQYYETAAHLGDTDAMNEAAWCYLEGYGGKKDRFKAAQLLRLAEKSGSKTLGNSWIWKEKYDTK